MFKKLMKKQSPAKNSSENTLTITPSKGVQVNTYNLQHYDQTYEVKVVTSTTDAGCQAEDCKVVQQKHSASRIKLQKLQEHVLMNEEELVFMRNETDRMDEQISALEKYAEELKFESDKYKEDYLREKVYQFKDSAPELYAAFRNAKTASDHLAFTHSAVRHIQMITYFFNYSEKKYKRLLQESKEPVKETPTRGKTVKNAKPKLKKKPAKKIAKPRNTDTNNEVITMDIEIADPGNTSNGTSTTSNGNFQDILSDMIRDRLAIQAETTV